jgi:hypothetical protein
LFLDKAASYFFLDNNTSFLLVCFRDGVALCEILNRKGAGNMKVNILGTEYDVKLLDDRDETMKAMSCDGYTDYSVKKIRVLDVTKNTDSGHQEDIERYQKLILKHELIHAFLYESGIDFKMQFHNEEMVDWLAMQFPKISEVFDKMEI